MNNAFKPLWGLFLIIVLFVLVMSAARWSQGEEIVPWRDDYAAARAEAVANDKPLLVYFTAAWCRPCQRMKTTTWADQRVEAALRDYVPVKVDVDHQPAIANEYRVEAVPSFLILGPEGVTRATSGYHPPQDFLRWLEG